MYCELRGKTDFGASMMRKCSSGEAERLVVPRDVHRLADLVQFGFGRISGGGWKSQDSAESLIRLKLRLLWINPAIPVQPLPSMAKHIVPSQVFLTASWFFSFISKWRMGHWETHGRLDKLAFCLRYRIPKLLEQGSVMFSETEVWFLHSLLALRPKMKHKEMKDPSCLQNRPVRLHWKATNCDRDSHHLG